MVSKIINFKANSKTGWDLQPKPYPAVQTMPKWFLEKEPYETFPPFPPDGKLHVRDGRANPTFKKCVPMQDAMSAGYIIPLWTDVMAEQKDGKTNCHWLTRTPVFEVHINSHDTVVPPPGYENIVLKYYTCWIPQTPPGYSCLITSPFGHHDLPFRALTGIIDTDKSVLEVLFPMFPKKGLDGVIEKGTPMIQVIPFKRENWESTFNYYEDGEYKKFENKTFRGTIVGHYLKTAWSKKSFK